MSGKTDISVVISRQRRKIWQGNGPPHLCWKEIQMESCLRFGELREGDAFLLLESTETSKVSDLP